MGDHKTWPVKYHYFHRFLTYSVSGAHATRASRTGGYGVLELSVSESREASADRRPHSPVYSCITVLPQ